MKRNIYIYNFSKNYIYIYIYVIFGEKLIGKYLACINNGKKSMLVRDRGSPYVCEMSRLPHFLGNRLTDDSELSALSAGRPLPPGRLLALTSSTH
jgi:hypothetical protein